MALKKSMFSVIYEAIQYTVQLDILFLFSFHQCYKKNVAMFLNMYSPSNS